MRSSSFFDLLKILMECKSRLLVRIETLGISSILLMKLLFPQQKMVITTRLIMQSVSRRRKRGDDGDDESTVITNEAYSNIYSSCSIVTAAEGAFCCNALACIGRGNVCSKEA